ncbi:arylsulfatase [Draconibacterium sp.]|nr:arylsulfatase [Draconibacterium sp.]
MKKSIKLFFLVLSFIVYSCGIQVEESTSHPNIILIMSDDMGYSDIGCYGSEINTPNLDGLAENGLRFTQFYNTARCCPTRASLISGLHPHQAGVGHMMNDRGTPAYQGNLNHNCVTIAEVLKTAGYSTYMAGKWHVTPLKPSVNNPNKENWPLQRGFDKFFGTIHGAGSFYDPNSLTSGNEFIAPEEDFYYTDAISDTTVKYIHNHNSNNPFFIYVPYTAAHWPMHALPKDIAKYKGIYDKGWDEVRKERYNRMLEMGLIKPEWKMSERYPDKPWDETGLKDWQAVCMEVYAAMIDNMDQGIGRIVNALKEKGELENTLIFFLQDNGACAEAYAFGRTAKDTLRVDPDTIKPLPPGYLQTRMEPLQTRDGKPVRAGYGVYPGPADTYIGYDQCWSNASNTPFRMFKHWVNEGGISTPLIVHWPDGFQAKNEFRQQPGQLVDIMATCVDVSGAEYPQQYQGNKIIPMEGTSLAPAFKNEKLEREYLYWEHEGNRAIRKGKWKLVSEVWFWPHMHDSINELPLEKWELYDLEADRTELNNLADKNPELVKELANNWLNWAKRTGAVPKPPNSGRKPEWVKERIHEGKL